MEKYQLCLFYSTKVYFPLFDITFKNYQDIDKIMMNYQDENAFRNSKEIFRKINLIQSCNYNYISKVKDANDRKGKILIVKEDGDEITYISPLYQSTKKYTSPKVLINSIVSKLKRINNCKLLGKFLIKFQSTFFTKANLCQGINKLKNYLYYDASAGEMTETDRKKFNKTISIIKDTLNFPYNKQDDYLNEKLVFLYRVMNGYLDSYIYRNKLNINEDTISKVRNSNLKKDESVKTSNNKVLSVEKVNEYHTEFLNRVYADTIARGEELSLFDIERAEYEKELAFFNDYYSKPKGKNNE